MDVSAPERADIDLQKETHKSLIQAGYQVKENDLKPDDTSPLENIQRVLGDKAYDIGTAFGATIGPEVSFDRTTRAKGWLRGLRERAFAKLRDLRNKEVK